MANTTFTRLTNFETKDGLASGSAAKRVKGTEIEDEFAQVKTVVDVKADINSPALTGTPTVPTASAGTNTTQAANTAFVTTAVANGKVSPALTGTPTAPTASASTDSTQIATTAFVQDQKASPAFTGTPTAPTASASTDTTQIATTAFVQDQKASPAFTGTPTAPTASAGTNTTQIATTAYVETAKTAAITSANNYTDTEISDAKVSPAFTGTPTAPTASASTNNTQIATTAYVTTAISNATPTAAEVNGHAYPVGSVYTSVVSTNPATLLGVGTWVAFGAGRVLVGLDASQTEFDTVEETGGSKTHTLTESELPSHTHNTLSSYQNNVEVIGSSVVTITEADRSGADGDVDIATSSTGSGAAHNNLQPYITVYFWKRTA